MKSKTANLSTAASTDERLPTVADYVAAGHDPTTAEALVGFDEVCEKRATALEDLGTEGRARLAARYAAANEAIDQDSTYRAERAASRKAYRAWKAALNDGGTIEVARQRAANACGRSDLSFDYTKRADELRQEAFAEWGARNGRTRPRARQRRETGGRRSSSGSADSGDDGLADPEPLAARLCKWCGADIGHLNADAWHCNAKHRVYAHRARDKADPERVAERTAARQRSTSSTSGVWTELCECEPKGNLAPGGLCFTCGRPRWASAVAWLADPAPPLRRPVVSSSPEHKWRTSDGKRHPKREIVDSSIIKRGVAA